MAAAISSRSMLTVNEQIGGYMRLLGYCRILAEAAVFCLLPTTVLGQEFSQIKRNNNAPPKPSGPTPRTADGHPDLTGVWNGLGDNLLGVPNQIANNGVSIDGENSSHDIATGTQIATFPRNAARGLNNEQAERAASLLRRVGSNR